MTLQDKPHKGSIRHWWKHDTPGRGLGYIIRGQFVDHPQFQGETGCTSYVVASYERPDGTIEIETRNSRYTLIGQAREVAKAVSGGVLA